MVLLRVDIDGLFGGWLDRQWHSRGRNHANQLRVHLLDLFTRQNTRLSLICNYQKKKKTSRFTQDQENDNDAGVKRKNAYASIT